MVGNKDFSSGQLRDRISLVPVGQPLGVIVERDYLKENPTQHMLFTKKVAHKGIRNHMPDFKESLVIVAKFLIGAILSVWSSMHPVLQTLFWISLIDIGSGLLASGKAKNLCSQKAWSGARKKGMMWLIIGASILLNRVVNLGFDFSIAMGIYFIVTEMLSIIENAGVAGVYVPAWVRVRLKQLADQEPQSEPMRFSRPTVNDCLTDKNCP